MRLYEKGLQSYSYMKLRRKSPPLQGAKIVAVNEILEFFAKF